MQENSKGFIKNDNNKKQSKTIPLSVDSFPLARLEYFKLLEKTISLSVLMNMGILGHHVLTIKQSRPIYLGFKLSVASAAIYSIYTNYIYPRKTKAVFNKLLLPVNSNIDDEIKRFVAFDVFRDEYNQTKFDF